MPRQQFRIAWSLALALASAPAAFGQEVPPGQPVSVQQPPSVRTTDGPWVFPDAPAAEKTPADNFILNGLQTVATWSEQAWDLLAEAPPHHPSEFGLAGQPGMAAPTLTRYNITWFPDAGVAGQGTNLGYVRQDLSVSCPLWKDDCNAFAFTTDVRSLLFHTQAVIPDTTQAFPQELWDIRFGVSYKHTFDNGWTTGGTVNFGSASDKPFHSFDELTAGVMAFLRIPVGEHNAWLFSMMYSPTGELSFPIPGAAFYWQPSDTFNTTIGIPFKVVWRPTDDFLFEASYMPLTNVRVRGTYHVWGGVSVYAGYDNSNEAYFLANRADSNDRFFEYDQRLTAGVKMQFGKHVCLDLSSGYSFDRHFFEGHSISDQGGSRIDVGDTPFGSFMLEVRY